MSTTANPSPSYSATGTRGRFAWHELMTTDPATAQDFYKEVVGWNTTKMEGGPMEYWLWLAGETPIGGLMAMQPNALEMGARPGWLAYIEVPDTDASVDQAVKLGGSVLVPAQTVPQAGRFAVLQDPQGAVFAVIKSENELQPENDPAPHEFSWHELTTSDLPGGISFYEQLFGWEKKSEFDMGPEMGVYHMFGRDRFTYGGMMTKTQQPGVYWLHYVRVADSADAAAERAKNLGATVMVGPMEVPGGDRIAVISDPQGAVFAVHSKA